MARQLAYSETGSGVETTIVDDRVVARDRVLLAVGEAAFRSELTEIMLGFRRELDQVARTNATAVPYMVDANRRVGAMSLGVNRFVAETSVLYQPAMSLSPWDSHPE